MKRLWCRCPYPINSNVFRDMSEIDRFRHGLPAIPETDRHSDTTARCARERGLP